MHYNYYVTNLLYGAFLSNYIGCDKQENFYELYMQNNYFFHCFQTEFPI